MTKPEIFSYQLQMITALQKKLKLSKKEQQFALYYILDNQKLIKSYINKLATTYTIQQQYEELKQEIATNFQFLANMLQNYDQNNNEQLYQIATSFYTIQDIITAVVKLQLALRNTLYYPINIENFKVNQQKPFFYGLYNQEFIPQDIIYKLFTTMNINTDNERKFFENIIQHNSRTTFQLNIFLQKNKNQQINQLQQKIKHILVLNKGQQSRVSLIDQNEHISYSEYQKLLKEEQQQLQKISKFIELNKSFKNEYCKIPVTQNGLEIVQHVNMTKINIINQTFRDMNIQMDQIDENQLNQFLQEQGYRNNLRKQIQLNYYNGAYHNKQVSQIQNTYDDDIDIGNVLTLEEQQKLAQKQSLLEQQELERQRQEEQYRLKQLQKLKYQQELQKLEKQRIQEEERQQKLVLEQQMRAEMEKQRELEKQAELQRVQLEKKKLEEIKQKQLEEQRAKENQLKQIKQEVLQSFQGQEKEIIEKMIKNMNEEQIVQYLQKVRDYNQIKNEIQAKKQERKQLISNYQQNKDIESLRALNKNTQEIADLYYRFHKCTNHLTDEQFNLDKELFNKLLEAYDMKDIIVMLKEKLMSDANLEIPPYALDMIVNYEFVTYDDKDRIKQNFLKLILKQYDINSQDYLDYIIQQFYDETAETNGDKYLIDYIVSFDQKFQDYYDKVVQSNENQMYILSIPIENQFQTVQQNEALNPLFQLTQQETDKQEQQPEGQDGEITNIKQQLQDIIAQTQQEEDKSSYKTLYNLKFDEETNQNKFMVPQFYTLNEQQTVEDDADIQLHGLVDENLNIHRYFIIRLQDKHFEKRFDVYNSYQPQEVVLPQLKQISPTTNTKQQQRIYKQRNVFCCAPPILK